MIGTEISVQYRIEELIGVGGFGKVFRGIDLRDNEIVAIKQLSQHMSDSEHIERFKREGEALRDLNHPNIVKMLDAVQDGDSHYLIMEYVSGGDLDDLLKQGTIPLEQTLTYAIDLADALTRAHKLNIIHRDLKPANVLIGDDGVLRLTDFGVSRIGGKDKITETGAPIGTFAYMAPEVFNSDWIDPRADIWAFGVMLFEMLTGELPFQGNSITQLIMSITANDPPDIEMLAPDVPPSLVRLIERMLEKDRSERIASVRYVGAHLEDILQGRDTPLAESISIEQVLKLPVRPEHNLPSDLTPFVGREVEIAEVTRLINDPALRLVTILASGGMGKTRIAIEIARHYIGQFRDGVFLVSLQALSNPENIVAEIASSTDFPLQGRDAKQQVLQFLANKHMLLVFDNFEHLLDGTSIIADIMAHAPDVTMLVTSRERLHLSAETVYLLPEMACPMEILQDMLNFDAVRFLIQSAQHVKSDWQLTDDKFDDVFRVTQLTQGMPLGILLAMSWLDMMSIGEIANEIQRDIDFLSADLRDLPDRHQSVRAIFNGTWNRLNEREQSAFMKMSIFRGGFTREAAQEVTGANLRVLHALTNKSLIQMDESGRYSIHELLRQFAEEQLNATDDSDAVRDAHMNYYANWYSQEGSIERVMGPDRLNAIQLVDHEFDNIQLMWAHAQEREALDLIIDVLSNVPLFRGNTPRQAKPNARLISDLMAYLQAQPSWNETQERLYMQVCGRYQPNVHEISGVEHESNLQRGLVIAEKYGELKKIAGFKSALSRRAVNQKDYEKAKNLYEEALSIAYQLNDYLTIIVALMARGYYLILAEGDLKKGGIENSLEIMQLAREHGDIGMMSNMAYNLALPYHALDEWDEARKWAEEALKLSINAKDHEKQFDGFLFLQDYSIVFMHVDDVTLFQNHIDELAKYRNTVIRNWLINFREGLSLFIEGKIASAQELMIPWYMHRKKVGNPDGMNGAARWKALCDSQLGNFSACVADLIHVIPLDLKFSWNSHLILDCMVFLPMLQDQSDDIRSVELIAMMNEHPKALPISSQHPYVLELEAQLHDRLDEDTYQQAWGRGAQLDPLVVAPALMEEFTAIYG